MLRAGLRLLCFFVSAILVLTEATAAATPRTLVAKVERVSEGETNTMEAM